MAIGKLPDSADEDAGADDGSLFAEINITPLTDVFLVMVVIFMVTALAEVEQTRKEQKQITQQQEQSEQEKKSGLKITLPQGKAQEIDTSKASLVLMIPMQGDVEIGGKAMHDADIDAVFAAAFQRDKGTQVILKADKGVPHGKVVNLMERAKGAGLTHLAIGTSGT
jgi:biopolymer transport protein ExbD